MLMKQRGGLVSTKKRTNTTKAIAFVETTLFISENSEFQPGLWTKNFEWWSRSLKFEFPFNRHILCSKPVVQIMQWFLVFNFGPNRSGAGAKNFGCLKPEPEIWLSTPQSWFQLLRTLPLACVGRFFKAGCILISLIRMAFQPVLTFDALLYDLLNCVAFARCRRHRMSK